MEKTMVGLIDRCTSNSMPMREVGHKMAKQCFDNRDEKLADFNDPVLDDAIENDFNFKAFANNILVKFNQELKNVGGDIDLQQIKVSVVLNKQVRA